MPLAILVVCLSVYLTAGAFLIPHAGIQNDEALFGGAVFSSDAGTGPADDFLEVRERFLKFRFRLMLMSYLGTLKATLYSPILRTWDPTPVSIRIPVLLAGALTLLLLYQWLRNCAGLLTAAFACLLTALDPTYVLTTCFDWGPTALQRLLLVAALSAAYGFYHSGHLRRLAVASFCCGLAAWDKALFAWVFAGLLLSGATLFFSEIRARWSWRGVQVATLGFIIGSSPLILYNVKSGGATFGNARWSSDDLAGKAALMKASLDGSSLFGYIVRERDEKHPEPPGSRSSWILSLYVVCLAGLPFLGRAPERKLAWFSLLTFGIAWAQMLFTRDTGGGIHHTSLLLPLPQIFAGAVLGGLARRGRIIAAAAVAAVAIVAATQALVLQKYHAHLTQVGASRPFTDALTPLFNTLRSEDFREIQVTDWGMLDTLHLMGKGKLPLRNAAWPLLNERMSDDERRDIARRAAADVAWAGHVDDQVEFAHVNVNLKAIEREFDLAREPIATVPDRQGRPMFEVFRLVPRASPRPTVPSSLP